MRKDCVSNCMVLFGGMREMRRAVKGQKCPEMPKNGRKMLFRAGGIEKQSGLRYGKGVMESY